MVSVFWSSFLIIYVSGNPGGQWAYLGLLYVRRLTCHGCVMDLSRTKSRMVFNHQRQSDEPFIEYLHKVGQSLFPLEQRAVSKFKNLVFGTSLIGLVQNSSVTRLLSTPA